MWLIIFILTFYIGGIISFENKLESSRENSISGIPTRSYPYHPAQLRRLDRKLKFGILICLMSLLSRFFFFCRSSMKSTKGRPISVYDGRSWPVVSKIFLLYFKIFREHAQSHF